MSEFPTHSLVAKIQAIILATFELSQQDADTYASSFAMLAEDWGSKESAAQLDWQYRVRKELGQKLRWKSEVEREKFFSEQQQWHKDYDKIFSSKNRA